MKGPQAGQGASDAQRSDAQAAPGDTPRGVGPVGQFGGQNDGQAGAQAGGAPVPPAAASGQVPGLGVDLSSAARRGPRPALFLARHTYRQRRLRDAARMLPVLGIVLWLMPLLWRRAAGETGGAGSAVLFVFVAWTVLILLAALIAHRLRPDGSGADDAPAHDLMSDPLPTPAAGKVRS